MSLNPFIERQPGDPNPGKDAIRQADEAIEAEWRAEAAKAPVAELVAGIRYARKRYDDCNHDAFVAIATGRIQDTITAADAREAAAHDLDTLRARLTATEWAA